MPERPVSERTLRVAVTVNSLAADHGGPSRSATALADAVARAGVDVHVLAGRNGAPVRPARAALHLVPPASAAALLGRATAYDGALRELAPDVVHDHGLWLPSNHASARAARALGRPLVVSPRGMLSSWALAHRRWKKRLVWALFQRAHLERAALIHATADMEAEDVRRAGLRAPVAVVPNGVDIPASLPRRPPAGPRRRALFLSRVHPKKGIPMLIEAWRREPPSGWELVVVGPDEDGHGAAVDAQAARAGIPYTRLGPADDAAKWALYRSADLFVLPTYSENFGIVVAEALAAGVPVLTTTGTPWHDLPARGCGWWVAPNTDAIAAALAEATALSPERLHAMGARGAAYVEEAYGWTRIGEQMAAAYAWLVHGGACPPHVHLA
ncbi:MAG: glycosyltransferase [Rubricoccaceae bacterium]